MGKFKLFKGAVAVSSLMLVISGCGSSDSSSTGTQGNNVTAANAITIDNAGTIPVLGNATTNSVIYVHNNSNVAVSGISYSSTLNAKSVASALTLNTPFLDPQSAALCSTIQAFQSCPLKFTTPPLADHATQGSALVTLTYQANGKATSFSQILNYEDIVSQITEGVKFGSGVNISGFGHSVGYATVYLYGSGQNNVYTVQSLTSNRSAVSIVNGNVTGQQIASNYVQAVEISSPIVENPIGAELTVRSTTDSTRASYTSTASVGVTASASGGILVAGEVPVIDTKDNASPGGSLLINNSGNASVTLGTSTAGTGITNLSGCASGTVLGVGQSCTITFKVTQSGGSGTITVNYTGGANASAVSQSITWFNSLNGALVSMNYASPVTFKQSTTLLNTVTIRNIGGYNLTGLTIPSPQTLSGAAIATISSSNNTCTGSLNVGQSCQYVLSITDGSVDENKQILFGISGSYNNGTAQSYSRYAILTYSTIANAPNLVYIPSPAAQMTIQGNNVESATQTIHLSNQGNATATITGQGFQAQYTSLFSSTTSCTSTLNQDESCPVTIKLLPYSASQQVTGTAVYAATYTGGSVASPLTALENVPYTITPNQQSVSLESPTVSGSTGGTGTTSGSPYLFPGYGTNQLVTLTFQNSGSNPIKMTGIQDTNSALTWLVNKAQSTCYSSASIAPGSTCTIVYNNVLNQTALAIPSLGSSYAENLIVPTVIFADTVATTTQFVLQPTLPAGGTTVYAQANLATVTNSVTVNNAGLYTATVTVLTVLTNGSGYNQFNVTATMENYFTNPSTPTNVTSCTSTESNSIVTRSCTLSSSATNASSTYAVESGFVLSQSVILHTLFELNNSNQAMGMNTTYISTTIPKESQ